MDRSQMTVANLRYQSSKGGKGFGKVRDLARYFQYRQDRDQHIPQISGVERWVDHGLGNNFRQIAETCENLKSEHVQAFFLVINPNPDLIAFVPEDQREQFVKELTENTLEKFFEERGMGTPEYSYCYHLRETRDKADPGRDNPHMHVILPGSYLSWADGARLPLYMNRSKRENHIELLHSTAQEQIGVLLARDVGLDWEQRYDTLIAERQQEIETSLMQPLRWKLDKIGLSLPAPEEQPHAIHQDPQGNRWDVWVGQQPDLFDDSLHVGFIMRGKRDGKMVHEFVPKIPEVTQFEANAVSDYMINVLKSEGLVVALRFADEVGSPEFLKKWTGQPEPAPQPPTPSYDLDL